MSEARVKDSILEQLKAFRPHNEIEGLSKYISNLERDGYVSAVRDEEGDLIVVRITSRGKTFLANGGYSAIRQRSKPSKLFTSLKTLRTDIWSLAVSIIAGLVIAYLSKRLGWI